MAIAQQQLQLPVASEDGIVIVPRPMPMQQAKEIFNGVMSTRADRLSSKLGTVRDELSEQSVKTFQTMFDKVVTNLFKVHGATLIDCTTEQVKSAVAANGRRGEHLAKPASAETTRRYYKLMTDVFEHMIHAGLRTNNPSRVLLEEATASMTFEVDDVASSFTEADEKKFLESLSVYVHEKPQEWTRRRDRAMLMLMLGAGLKPSETIRLQLGQVERRNLDGSATPSITVKVSANGIQQSRIVPVDEFAAPAIEEWLHLRATIRADHLQLNDLLFPSLTGADPIRTNTVYGVMVAVLNVEKAAVKVLPWEKSKGTNTLRNTYCIRHLANGTPPETLAERMGYRAVESLDRYRHTAYRPQDAKRPAKVQPTTTAALFD
jgi:site-specific recombinase XerD